MQYVTLIPAWVIIAMVPLAPKSTSSGWAVTTSTRVTPSGIPKLFSARFTEVICTFYFYYTILVYAVGADVTLPT